MTKNSGGKDHKFSRIQVLGIISKKDPEPQRKADVSLLLYNYSNKPEKQIKL